MFRINQLILKNTAYIISYFILIAYPISNLHAQNSDSLLYFQGQVISKSGEYPIAFAHIINYTQKWGVTADTTGHFEIWGYPGDTLNVSAIGFHYHNNEVLDISSDNEIIIELENRAYEIPEATISYLGSYQQFERKVVNLDLPKIEFNPQVESIFKHVERAPLVVKPTVTSPASLIYVLFSKEAKDFNKFLDLEKDGETKDKIWEKLNEHIVRNITGLSLDESKKFIEYCNFKDEFILKTTNYNLYSTILKRFEDYKKSHQDSLIIE